MRAVPSFDWRKCAENLLYDLKMARDQIDLACSEIERELGNEGQMAGLDAIIAVPDLTLVRGLSEDAAVWRANASCWRRLALTVDARSAAGVNTILSRKPPPPPTPPTA